MPMIEEFTGSHPLVADMVPLVRVSGIDGVEEAVVLTGEPIHEKLALVDKFKRVGVVFTDNIESVDSETEVYYPFEQEGGKAGDMPTYALTNGRVIYAAVLRAKELREIHDRK